ncbi:MAG: hypothetical protein LBD10_11815 [Desulfobulbus sp.]|jgi:hypothetical protein|uniref:hypothetical protein n=1 Tax=Desulfobulbus sp. TaxID=895 RepID=UPI00283C9878|nr:hypothetical protein [Desulfobulbus sp.]MDR2550873.1 hypothetical protein [Desulfobulbus sp.]
MGADRLLRLGLLLLCCLATLAGCAGKQPKTVPLAPSEEQEARALWTDFVGAKRPQALDADVRLQWDVMGSKGGVGASLSVQRPALVRVSANDPLGRTLILAVADASAFTMVDNRSGQVYRGTIQSRFWRSYVPEAVQPDDLLPLLGGFLAKGEGDAAVPSWDEAGRGIWYQWRDDRKQHHYVLLDKASGTMLQHLLLDDRGDRDLVLQYADYRKENGSEFSWPARLRITGQAVTGTLSVQVERVFSYSPQEAAAFRVVPPPHFTVERVD